MQQKNTKYANVINWINENISSGILKVGDKLNSENELSRMFGLSRQTVRHAIDILEQQKVLVRVQGSGTYIGSVKKAVRKEKYRNIAVISTYVDGYIFPSTIKGIEDVLSGHGYMTQIAFTNDSVSREYNILESLIAADNIDGLIVEPAKSALPNPNIHYYEIMADRGIPVIFFNANYPELNMPCVRLDDEEVSYKAVRYLLEQGHRKTAGIFKSDDGQGHLRYAGFVRALREAGIAIEDRHVVWIDSEDLINLEEIMDYLKRRFTGCSAVMCYNDEVAYQIISMFGKEKIPEVFSVIAIDNSDLAEYADVPFTSFPHHKEKLGRKVAENMVRLIENPDYDANYMFDADIVTRDSVKDLTKDKAEE